MDSAQRLAYRLPPSSNPDLDFLLGQVAEAIQLTETQDGNARRSYAAITDWLSAPESPLAAVTPRIYPQGSMRLGTTVKPRGRVEHDLDLVCQVTGGSWTAMALYEAVYQRLHASRVYRPMLTQKNRCVCVEYAGQFHLDIIPAVADLRRGGTCVLVPDCKLEDWTPSDPKGYAQWFDERSVTLLMERLAKAHAEPVPAQKDACEKPPLAVAVQLIKRARDVMFNGADAAPRSIILTTLAAHHYTGGTCVVTTLIEILRGITHQIRGAAPHKIEIVNPTNPDEKFSDALTDERYEALRDFAATLGARVSALLEIEGVDRLQKALEKLFDDAGAKPVTEAVKRYAERQKRQRDAGLLTYSSAGLGVVAPVSSSRVPRNNNYGD